MNVYLAEFIGTMLLVLLGDGVVANVALKESKGHGGGWIVIATGWGLAVTVAVYCIGTISGGHINPAVTIAMALIDKLPWSQAPPYIAAQLAGAFVGAILVWLTYLPHWQVTQDKAAKLGVFCTIPAIRRPLLNALTEAVGTFVLVLGVLAIASTPNLSPDFGWDKGFGPFLVGALVASIGLSLGGPTGYAINPARDLGPRLAHLLLPIPNKGPSDFAYAWVPALAPIAGGALGAFTYKMLW